MSELIYRLMRRAEERSRQTTETSIGATQSPDSIKIDLPKNIPSVNEMKSFRVSVGLDPETK